MPTLTTTSPQTALNRGAVTSLVGHFAIVVLGVFAAVDMAPDPATTTFWSLAAFAALGAVATVAIWRATRVPREAGRSLLGTAVGLLAVSVLVVVYGAVREGSLAVLLVAALMLMIDSFLFAAARRALAA